MIINGRAIAQDIKEELRAKIEDQSLSPKLSVIYLGEDPVIENFIGIKKRFGKRIGAELVVHPFAANAAPDEVLDYIAELNDDPSVQGIIIQLPLPEGHDAHVLLNAVAEEKDVDALSAESNLFLSPVVGAVRKVLKYADVDVSEKRAVVVGEGKLVGAPVSKWLREAGAEVTVVKKGEPLEPHSSQADIIVTGAGVPGLLQPEMIKGGCVLIDAGTSESGGVVVGDADPACAPKCAVFTPVPGGVGPLTVACLYENLYRAAMMSSSRE